MTPTPEPTAADVVAQVEAVLWAAETVHRAGGRKGMPHVWTDTVRDALREVMSPEGNPS